LFLNLAGVPGPYETGILDKWISCIVAQTIVRQLDAARKSINLVCALPNITEKTLNRIGAANVAVHHLWKGVECQQMLFIFH
jgi:hypothetical protein